MLIYKTLEKSWILRMIDFTIIHIGVLTYLGVPIFGVTLEDCAHMFVKRQELTQFVFIVSTRIKREDWKECDMKK